MCSRLSQRDITNEHQDQLAAQQKTRSIAAVEIGYLKDGVLEFRRTNLHHSVYSIAPDLSYKLFYNFLSTLLYALLYFDLPLRLQFSCFFYITLARIHSWIA